MILFFLAFAAFFVVALLVIVSTIGITLASLVTLFSSPAQFRRLLRDRQLRRNHALEHATINVIEERYGPSRLAGLAEDDGFTIQGGATPDLVASAAQEALDRLRAGERKLAIQPRCGTSLIASQLVLAIIFLAAVVLLHELSWIAFVAGLLAAIVLGPRLSLVLQRFITTDARIGNLNIVSVEVKRPAGKMGLVSMMVLGPIFVHTAQGNGPTTRRRAALRREPEQGDATLITGEREEIPVGGYRVR
jgi:hypothetical protein